MLDFEELGYEDTPIGELSLRRRQDPRLDGETVYEIKLGGDYLMSSYFTVGERALATLGLERLSVEPADVLVGGLGLGYTAAEALADERIGSVLVVEAFGAVIEWHRQGLVPNGALAHDPRCRLVCADFFALAQADSDGFDHDHPGRRFDAILLDIDHSPRERLVNGPRSFYEAAGLESLHRQLRPGGVFAMWSDEAPDDTFLGALTNVFASVDTRIVRFENAYTGQESSCTIYRAWLPPNG